MSFSGDTKKELAAVIGRARHCQIAELTALLVFCGSVKTDEAGNWQICFRSDHRDVAEKYTTLLQRIFHLSPDIVRREDRRRKKTEQFLVTIGDKTAAVSILQAIHILDGNGNLRESVPLVHQTILQRNCCRRAFLRGAFLAAGSISDPNSSYHFELVCGNEEQAVQLQELLQELGITAGRVRRKKYHVVYVKESGQISDLLGMMDARVSMLSFESIRVVRDVRGNVNRKVNCETANINRTANAAARQIEDIEWIEKTMGFSKLPNRLDEVAQIRLQYPTATLAELGQMMDPPLGKSGVNHRLRRLGEIADELREEQGGSIQDG